MWHSTINVDEKLVRTQSTGFTANVCIQITNMPNVSMEVLHISYLNEKILPDEIQASSFQYRLASDARVKYGLTLSVMSLH